VLGNWTFLLSGNLETWKAHTCRHTRPDDITSVMGFDFDQPGFTTKRRGTFTLHDNYSSNATLCIEGACEDAEWTMVYDEGMAIYGTQTGTELFLTFVFKPRRPGASKTDAAQFSSFCGETYTGWATAPGFMGCAVARNVVRVPPHVSVEQSGSSSSIQSTLRGSLQEALRDKLRSALHAHVDFKALAAEVNSAESSTWVADASAAKVFEGKSEEQVLKMYGGERSKLLKPKSFSLDSITDDALRAQEQLRRECVRKVLPAARDWSQSAFATRVVDQGDCGSCYAVASADAMTMRYRIAQQDAALRSFSPQHVLRCSAQNQGCNGGYPWLVSYFAGHEGMVTEDCPGASYGGKLPAIQGEIPPCDDDELRACNRTFALNYGYVGGYYGRGNAEDMMWSIERDGPLVVAINPDHQSGFSVYHHGLFESKGGEAGDAAHGKGAYWERTTHAVVLVGYGSLDVNSETVPTWKIKNSWGAAWGDAGYVTVQRGVDAMAVESMPVHFSFRHEPGNPGFELGVRNRLVKYPECAEVIDSMLRTGFL